MKPGTRKSLAAATLLAAALSPSAQAAPIGVAIVGAAQSSDVSISNQPTTATVSGVPITNIATTTKPKLGFGGGLLFDTMMASRLGLELGVLYGARKTESITSYTALGVNTSTDSISEARFVQLPLLARLWLHPMLSVGAGGYYAQGVGQVSNKNQSTGATTKESFQDAGLKKTDYGILGSVQLRLRLSMAATLLLDGRYTQGLANVSATSDGTVKKFHEVQGLVGFAFGMGGKR